MNSPYGHLLDEIKVVDGRFKSRTLEEHVEEHLMNTLKNTLKI